MKQKQIKDIIFPALLLLTVTFTLLTHSPAFAVDSKSEPESSFILTSLSEQQRDELERMIDDRLERSATVSDRIQETVNQNFGLLFAISGLTISALGAIPVFSAAIIFFSGESSSKVFAARSQIRLLVKR